ncbi:hypothetical protein HKD37_U059038 [Glycine soja]
MRCGEEGFCLANLPGDAFSLWGNFFEAKKQMMADAKFVGLLRSTVVLPVVGLAGKSWTGRIKATRAESQWIVAARPLCHLQYPSVCLNLKYVCKGFLPLDGRVLQGVSWELIRRAERSPTARAFEGGRGPLLRNLGHKRTWQAHASASSPDY